MTFDFKVIPTNGAAITTRDADLHLTEDIYDIDLDVRAALPFPGDANLTASNGRACSGTCASCARTCGNCQSIQRVC